MIAKSAIGAVLAILLAASTGSRIAQSDDAAVQAAYSAFVSNLNALSMNVTEDVWDSRSVVRLLGFDVDELAEPGLPRVAVQDIAVLHVDDHVALAAVTRTARWPLDGGREGDAVPDAALAVLLSDVGQKWKVTYQHVVPPGALPVKEPSVLASIRSQVASALDGILQAVSKADAEAVAARVTPRKCRLMAGQVGAFLRDQKAGDISVERLEVLSASPDVCVTVADMKSHGGHGSASGRAESRWTRDVPRTLFIFSHVAASWRLDAEIVLR